MLGETMIGPARRCLNRGSQVLPNTGGISEMERPPRGERRDGQAEAMPSIVGMARSISTGGERAGPLL